MIDYRILNDSLAYYEALGYKRIEAPWTVSGYVDDITKPPHVQPFVLRHNDKHLVASGEQSFLYLYLKDFLPKGKFQTITPCFRFESFDYLHTKYFMKNELIITDTVDQAHLDLVVTQCLWFFKTELHGLEPEVVKTPTGFDIEVCGVELGSYGIRECDFLRWIYATGCAEPRLSRVITKYGLPSKED